MSTEIDDIRDMKRAYERFLSTVDSVPVDPPSRRPANAEPTGATASIVEARQRGPRASTCRRVREAFAETVRPCSLADVEGEEPLLWTIQEELGVAIARVLDPGTSCRFTPHARTAIRSTIADRQRRLEVMERALTREATSLRAAQSELDSIVDWLVTMNEIPLSKLDFPTLQQRHESLTDHRTTCETLLNDRQNVLGSTTNKGGGTTLPHRPLVEYLYQNVPVSYPVIVTVARLAHRLVECQRTVREHLVRRV